MAVNMALAAQYAAGVPLRKRCQLFRNLVPKTPKATILATAARNPNSAVKQEAALLVTTHLQSPVVRRNLVTKRGKRIMVSTNATPATTSPGNTVVPSDEPELTSCDIQNDTGLTLELDTYKKWYGSGDPPEEIEAKQTESFVHYAGSRGSIAGAAYTLGDSKIIKWLVVWSNREGRDNQVYSEILDGRAGFSWKEIKDKLDHDTTITHESKIKDKGYSSDLVIDPSSPAPQMKAILRKSP